jgi:hypothetical protein
MYEVLTYYFYFTIQKFPIIIPNLEKSPEYLHRFQGNPFEKEFR